MAIVNHFGGITGRVLLIVVALLALINVGAAIYFSFFETR